MEVSEMKYTIKQVSKITGITSDSLRYYDKLGIVSPKRSENGYRYYDEDDLYRLQYTAVMKYAQFTLSEIKSIMELFDREPTPECNAISKNILSSKVELLSHMVENYKHIIGLLKKLIPMVDDINSYIEHEGQIDIFVKQIYDDIMRTKPLLYDNDK